jgi:hypothetical protein
LPFQLFGVETHSFLPDQQSDRGDLARQCEPGHRRLHPLREQAGIEILKGASGAPGPGRRAFEDAFQIVIVILIETTQRYGLAGSLQLALHVAVLRAGVRLQRQTAVRPQLPLGAKPMRRLHERHQQSGPNRADKGNPLEQLRRPMPSARRHVSRTFRKSVGPLRGIVCAHDNLRYRPQFIKVF